MGGGDSASAVPAMLPGGGAGSFSDRNSPSAFCKEPFTFDASAMVGENDGVGAFGPAPSRDEVAKAISELDRFMDVHRTSQNFLDGRRGLLDVSGLSDVLQVSGYRKFRDSFNSMRTEPSFQNMVVSLSSDKAVWEAILSNKAVQDLQVTGFTAKEERRFMSPGQEQDILILILKWVLDFAKAKVLELAENFGSLVDMFQPCPEQKPVSELTHLLEEKIRSSFLLSVVIIMIVVVTRNPSLSRYMNN